MSWDTRQFEQKQAEQEEKTHGPTTENEPGNKETPIGAAMPTAETPALITPATLERRPVEREKPPGRPSKRGTAAMDESTRKEVARKGGLAVSRNREHMAQIGKKGGMTVSRNREHMAQIGRKGGAASRSHRKTS
ncbi:MAG: hypothetical protein AABZ06_06130 [Bdellovibrionota bacterium]